MQRILFIAPLPPPIHGQSLASEVLLRTLSSVYRLDVVNTAKKKDPSIKGFFLRFFEIFGILVAAYKGAKRADLVYFTISESRLGNAKDLLTYLIIWRWGKLRQTAVHLHGGAGLRVLFQGHPRLKKLNQFFLERVGRVIVLGKSLVDIFSFLSNQRKIAIIPNFAEDYLFIHPNAIKAKYRDLDKIRILYLSNLLQGKGYVELLEAANLVNKANNIEFHFAGAFSSSYEKKKFLDRLPSNVVYHGVVRGDEKKGLLWDAHIFCLPTYYPYEGQPISILEAYASGCVVITTDHSGIPDIFSDCENGSLVEKKSPQSIIQAIFNLIEQPEMLVKVGKGNLEKADYNYRASTFVGNLRDCLAGLHPN